MIFPSRAASNVVAGVILAMVACVIWAATMMTVREWGWFLLFVASCSGLVYFQALLRWLSGFRAKGAKGAKEAKDKPAQPSLTSPRGRPDSGSREPRRLINSLYESGALVNGRPHHLHTKTKL